MIVSCYLSEASLLLFDFISTLWNCLGSWALAPLAFTSFFILSHFQALVKYFFNFFRRASCSFRSTWDSLISLANLPWFVKCFFCLFWFASFSLAVHLTAYLYYQILPSLSTSFFAFFKIYFFSSLYLKSIYVASFLLILYMECISPLQYRNHTPFSTPLVSL